MTVKLKNDITVNIEMAKTVFQLKEDVNVVFTVKNNLITPIEFCYWQTPLEEEINADFFKITYNNKIVSYEGKMIKRRPPTKSDTISIKPYEKKSQTIQIHNAYLLNKPGMYTIRFMGSTLNGLPNSEAINFSILDK